MSKLTNILLGGTAALTLGAIAGIGVRHALRTPQVAQTAPAAMSMPVAIESSPSVSQQRQTFLEDMVRDMRLDYTERVEYDGDGSKKQSYLDALKEKHSPTAALAGIVGPPQNLANSGNYEMATMNALNLIGTGTKSPIFFGSTMFDDPRYKDFGPIEFKDAILQGNRIAQRYHSGFENIDSRLLAEKIESNAIPPVTVMALAEVDAHMYCLRHSPLSEQLPESVRRYHANNVALQLPILKKEYFKPGVSPFEQHFIRTVLKNNGIIIPETPVHLPNKK
jgi:hypothetical protein